LDKTLKIWIGLLVFFFAMIIIIQMTKPEKINWNPTYEKNGTNPFDLKVFYEELPGFFNEENVRQVKNTPYEYLEAHPVTKKTKVTSPRSYLFVDHSIKIDKTSIDHLLHFVAKGNAVFMSAQNFPKKLEDVLKFDISNHPDYVGLKPTLYFKNPQFKNDTLHINQPFNNNYIKEINKKTTSVLGYQRLDSFQEVNFVKIKHGKGNFYLHSQPLAFTNYFMLKDTSYRYAEIVLSHLPKPISIIRNDGTKTIVFQQCERCSRSHETNKACGNIIVDAYIPPAKRELGRSPLRFIWSQPPLKWAFIMALISLLVFVIFNAKRRQRIVPIIKPLENTTVDFVQTIGNLYLEAQDYQNIIDKKITYFLTQIRNDYLLLTDKLNDKFVQDLAAKSGKKIEDVEALVRMINHLKATQASSEIELKILNKAIEEFYNF